MHRTNHSANTDKRCAILNAARKRFCLHGLTKVTMDEIAADLGMSKAALYYYFSTKEEIFRQVVAQEREDFIRGIESIIKNKQTGTDKLGAYFAQHSTLLGTMLDLRMQAGDSIHPLMRDLFREFNQKEAALLKVILRDGKNQKEFNLDYPEKTALFVQHILVGLRIRFFKSIQDREFGKAEVTVYKNEIKFFADLFVRGISQQSNGAYQL